MYNRQKGITHFIQQIFFVPYSPARNGTDYGNEKQLFELEYSVPIVILCYDLVIFIIMVAFIIYNRFGAINKKWYHVIFAPVACIVVHFYHIIIAFIHTPQHATSILIFYALVVLIFYVTLKAAYHNLFKLYHSEIIAACLKNHLPSCCLKCSMKVSSEVSSWECWKHFAAKKIQPPTCTREDICRYFWVPCCYYFYTVDDNGREVGTKCKFRYAIVITIMSCLAVFIAGFIVFIVILFILIPINMAIDDAPARLLSIHQTILLFIGFCDHIQIV